MEAKQQSNHAWCEALYEQKAGELVLYGRALGLSHYESEDVVQETFVALLQMDSRPDQPTHYCVRAFRNRALNYRRSLWTRIRRELESHRWFERSTGESAQERATMRRLAELPQDQREVIVLKFWHRYTFDEIGGLLEVSPNTAAGRYRYGMKKLRSFLKSDEIEYSESNGRTDSVMETTSPFARATA